MKVAVAFHESSIVNSEIIVLVVWIFHLNS